MYCDGGPQKGKVIYILDGCCFLHLIVVSWLLLYENNRTPLCLVFCICLIYDNHINHHLYLSYL